MIVYKLLNIMDINVKNLPFTYEYSCVMLDVSQTIKNMIKKWGLMNISSNLLYINPSIGIFGYEYNPHLTIKYGIHEETPQNVLQCIQNTGNITINYGKISLFEGNPSYDVVKIDVFGDALYRMNELITRNVVSTDRYPIYSPHVTIAYIKKGIGKKFLNDETFDKLTDEASNALFTSINGKEYYINL